jgi:hypothetical protein
LHDGLIRASLGGLKALKRQDIERAARDRLAAWRSQSDVDMSS